MNAQTIKTVNARFVEKWRENIASVKTLDEILSEEGSKYDENKAINGRTFREIAEELKTEQLKKDDSVNSQDSQLYQEGELSNVDEELIGNSYNNDFF